MNLRSCYNWDLPSVPAPHPERASPCSDGSASASLKSRFLSDSSSDVKPSPLRSGIDLGLMGLLFLSNLKKCGHYFFYYFSVPLMSPSRDSNYIYRLGPLKCFHNSLMVFYSPFFPLWFILDSFFCCIFKFVPSLI